MQRRPPDVRQVSLREQKSYVFARVSERRDRDHTVGARGCQQGVIDRVRAVGKVLEGDDRQYSSIIGS